MKENPFDLHPDEYEKWFINHPELFEAELAAIKKLLPTGGKGLEIGIGSGIFASRLGIKHGIDPSEGMLKLARKRGLKVISGTAENLPYEDGSFDFSLFITSLCFISNPSIAIKEARRIIKENSFIITAIIDRETWLGKEISKRKDDSFFRHSHLLSTTEVISLLQDQHLQVSDIVQTLAEPGKPGEVLQGYGQGGFVVIKAKK